MKGRRDVLLFDRTNEDDTILRLDRLGKLYIKILIKDEGCWYSKAIRKDKAEELRDWLTENINRM